jgi:glutathione S-transferase
MAELALILGNKNYSSWSLRAYLALRCVGRPFDETMIPLGAPGTADRSGAQVALRTVSPTGLVPVLRHGDVMVWESLAIGLYLAAEFPDAGLLPEPRAARALALSVSTEMHGGFAALREHMPMDLRASRPGRSTPPAVAACIARITAIWRDCRARFGAGGAFLFGARFGLADCMYAPVVSRFRTYGVALDPVCAGYAEAVWTHPPMQDWARAARDEPWTIEYPLAP